MPRPHSQKSNAELQQFFVTNQDNVMVLQELLEELAHRRTPSARSLMTDIIARINEIEMRHRDRAGLPAQTSAPPNVELFGSESETEAEAEEHIPDDRERPSQLTLIRPVGTSGLPDAYVWPLKREVSLGLSADADLPDRFIVALRELIREIEQTGSGQQRYELEKGRRGETAGGAVLYHFPFSDEAELFQEAEVEVQVEDRKVDGTIVSMEAGTLILALKEDIGNEVRFAVLLIDATALLKALKEKIEAVKKGEITLNRTLADAVVQPSTLPKSPSHPVRMGNGSNSDKIQLNDSQHNAYVNALKEAVTFMWGPPGCGKSTTLAKIVHSTFKDNQRTLICSNTNKAVDEVLLKICEVLGLEHQAMVEGKIVRLGRVVHDKLTGYLDYVTVDGIAERRSADLKEKKQQLETEIAKIDASTQNAQQCLAKFESLDKSNREVTKEQENVNEFAREGKALKKGLSLASAQRDELAQELQLRRTAVFKFFRRSEQAIESDIQRNANECQQIEMRIRELKEQYVAARQHFEQVKRTYNDCLFAVAGQDRARAQAIIDQAKQKRDGLVVKLREIEAEISAIREAVLRNAKIVGATCTKTYLSQKDIGHVDLVIIDEASMVIRPVAWFSAGLARERVVISGDFRQIPPIVPTKQEAIFQELGLDPFTATERDKSDVSDRTMLNTQFRMCPEICDLISKPMYGDELTTDPKRETAIGDLPPNQFQKPLTIIDTSALWPFESQNAFFSRFNLLHALLVRNFVWHFRQNGLTNKKDLGVCTPYSAQARLIQKLIEGDHLDDFAETGTVHRFQGDERRIMLLEIPESYGGYWALGQFVQGVPPKDVGARLINVAVSRAKEHLVVLANLTYLDKRLPSKSLLRAILHKMQQQGNVVPGRELLKLRPIDSDLVGLIGQVEFDVKAESIGIFDERQFELGLAHDIQSAKKSVVLFSGYVTPGRVAVIGDLLRSRILAGVKVRCVTRPPKLNGTIPEATGREAISMLEGIEAVVDFRAKIHEKVCLIDNKIVWWGSLNALSHMGHADEMMTRVVNEGFAQTVAAHMSKRPVSFKKAMETLADAENPRCESCDAHSVYKEGRYGPYYECEESCGWKRNMKEVMRRRRFQSRTG